MFRSLPVTMKLQAWVIQVNWVPFIFVSFSIKNQCLLICNYCWPALNKRPNLSTCETAGLRFQSKPCYTNLTTKRTCQKYLLRLKKYLPQESIYQHPFNLKICHLKLSPSVIHLSIWIIWQKISLYKSGKMPIKKVVNS